MKSLLIALGAATLIVAGAGEAAAQSWRGPPPGQQWRSAPPASYGQRDYSRYQRDNDRYNGYYLNGRWYYGPPPSSYRYGQPGYRPGYVQWRHGQVLPPAYRSHSVNDWRRYGLRQPPNGYRWYSSNGDYVLASSLTGVILDLILGAH